MDPTTINSATIYIDRFLFLTIIGIMIFFCVKHKQSKNWIYVIAAIIFWYTGGLIGVLIGQNSHSNLVVWLHKLIGSIAGVAIVGYHLYKNNNEPIESTKNISKNVFMKYTAFTYTIALLQLVVILYTLMMVMSVVKLTGAARAQDVMVLVPMMVICPLLSVIAALIHASLKRYDSATKIFKILSITNRITIYCPIIFFIVYLHMIVTIHPNDNQKVILHENKKETLQADKPGKHVDLNQLTRADDILSLAENAQKSGDKKQAIALYERFIRLFPGMNKMSYLQLCSLYNQQKQYDMAEGTLRKALQYFNGDAVILTGLGSTLLIKGDTDSAIDILKQACQIAPNRPDSLYNLAWAYAKKGDTLAARTNLEKAMEKFSDVKYWVENNPDLKPLMGKVSNMIDPSKPIENKAVLPGHQVNLFLIQADAARKTGKTIQAIDLYEKAIDFDTLQSSDPFRHLGGLYFEQKQYDKAIATYRKALQVYKDDYLILNDLGAVLLTTGKNDVAIDCFNKSHQGNPTYTIPVYNLACAYARMGDKKTAQQYLETASKLNSEVLDWARNDPDLKSLPIK